jgi:hypothetical protein
MVVAGTVRPRRSVASVAGYSVEAHVQRLVAEAGESFQVHVSGHARLDDTGEFSMAIGGPGDPVDPVSLTVSAPDGTSVFSAELTLAEAGKPLRLRVATQPTFEIEPSDDPTLGARTRLTGEVIDTHGREVPSALPVVIWATDPPANGSEPPARPLVVTETQPGGTFSADWPADLLSEAEGRVSGGDPVPVPLDDAGRLPTHILLVIDLDDVEGLDDEACACADTPPRVVDPGDVTANPTAFSQDLGGGCVELSMPDRTLEEFSYFTVVRTTEPAIRGVTLGRRTPVPPELISDLLSVSIASQALRGSVAMRSLGRAPMENLTLDAGAAKALVRTDRPPSVTQVGRLAWLNTVGETKELIDAGLRAETGRTVLDADHAVDWDDTPTIHLAMEVAHGHLLQYREVWRADGYSLGDLLYSLPLAPGQRRQVAVVDWDRRTSSARTESLEFEEHLDALLARDRDVREIVGSDLHEQTSAGSRNTTWGVAGGIGAGFIGTGFGIFGGVAGGAGGSDSTSWQRSARQFSADSLQSLRDRVSQRASSARALRSTVVQTVAQGESLRAETESVANYNHCHAVTIEYFQVLRHLLVTHELADVQECLFVPLPIAEFDRGKALRWREPLTRYLRDRRLSGGFDAVERIADNWVGWDYPESRYSEEAPESLAGELRISFLLPRPRDAEDGTFQVDQWRWLKPFLRTDALELWTARLNDRTARERDRIFREEIAPEIAENLVNQLRFAYVGADGGQTEVPLDATLVSRYAERTPLYVTLNPRGSLPQVPREDIAHFRLWYDGTELPPDAQVIVHSGRVRYQAPHSSALLFDDPRILDDIRAGDPVVVSTPVSRAELRNPRDEDRDLADRLVTHLNQSLEHYHQAIWVSLDAQRRYMLLDAVLVPGLGGKSIASVCTNELIGIVGNSLVLPVAPGQRLDPTLEDLDPEAEEEPVDLVNAYATAPSPPLRISIPTRGVYAEAVSGECGACEAIDDSRYWRWTTDGQLALPEISPVSTATRALDEPDLTPTPLPAPLVSIQNAPDVPDPFGLKAAFELISKPELFRDITGLEGTQKNARAAFEGALSAASALGEQAHTLATQQELGKNAGRMIDRIGQARKDGLLTDAMATELTNSALAGLVGERSPAKPEGSTDTVQKVVDEASQADKAEIKVTNPSETVEVKFDETSAPVVGGPPKAQTFDPTDPSVTWVDQDIVIETPVSMAAAPGARSFTKRRVSTYAGLRGLLRAPDLTAMEAQGLIRKNPADASKFQLDSKLRVVYPADAKTPTKVAGTGRLPVVAISHGMAKHWFVGGSHPSHQGYTYLQEALAAQGIVSVSVDMNAANFFRSLVDMRAEMFLGALDRLRAMDADKTSRFFGRLDFDKVGVMGHSRGGEAAVAAAQLNAARTTGTYGITAVTALSPTDWTGTLVPAQVISADASVPFLLVLYPGLDGDLGGDEGARNWEGTGFRTYDRSGVDRSLVMVDHACHGRFNTTWPDEGTIHPDDTKAGGRLLSRADHQKVASEYIGGLFRWKLLGQNAHRDLFTGKKVNNRGTPTSIQWSFGGRRQGLDHLEPGVNPPVGTRTLTASTVVAMPDAQVPRGGGTATLEMETNHQTGVLAVAPGQAGPSLTTYRLELPSPDDWTGFDQLTFRLAVDADLTSPTTITNSPDPVYELRVFDDFGKTAIVKSTALTVPAKPVFHRYGPPTNENCTVVRLQTIAVPVTSLAGIKRNAVTAIEIVPGANFPNVMFFDSLQLVRQ